MCFYPTHLLAIHTILVRSCDCFSFFICFHTSSFFWGRHHFWSRASSWNNCFPPMHLSGISVSLLHLFLCSVLAWFTHVTASLLSSASRPCLCFFLTLHLVLCIFQEYPAPSRLSFTPLYPLLNSHMILLCSSSLVFLLSWFFLPFFCLLCSLLSFSFLLLIFCFFVSPPYVLLLHYWFLLSV